MLSTFSIEVDGAVDTAGDHTVVTQPDCLYGPKVIDVIMRKPGKVIQ